MNDDYDPNIREHPRVHSAVDTDIVGTVVPISNAVPSSYTQWGVGEMDVDFVVSSGNVTFLHERGEQGSVGIGPTMNGVNDRLVIYTSNNSDIGTAPAPETTFTVSDTPNVYITAEDIEKLKQEVQELKDEVKVLRDIILSYTNKVSVHNNYQKALR